MKTAGWMVLALGVLLMAGCTWVDLTQQGEKVRVLSADEVTKCEKRGETTVSLLVKLAGIERDKEKAQQELNTLARNSAATLEGDTVVPITPVENGQQTFAVYRCMPR